MREKCGRCGKELDRDGYYCISCLEYERERQEKDRNFSKSIGICPQCRKEKIYGDEKQCIMCRLYRAEWAEKNPWKEEQKQRYYDRFNLQQKNLYKERSVKGICTKCGKRKAATNRKKCVLCLEKDRIAHLKRA